MGRRVFLRVGRTAAILVFDAKTCPKVLLIVGNLVRFALFHEHDQRDNYRGISA